MKLHTEIFSVDLAEGRVDLETIHERLQQIEKGGKLVLRWGLVRSQRRTVLVEIGVLEGSETTSAPVPLLNMKAIRRPGITVSLVVPTGVGAAQGGFICKC